MFTCGRCGYASSKSHLKRHCQAKTPCEPRLDAHLSQSDVYAMYFTTCNQYKCESAQCDAMLISKKVRHMHHKRCKYYIADQLGNANATGSDATGSDATGSDANANANDAQLCPPRASTIINAHTNATVNCGNTTNNHTTNTTTNTTTITTNVTNIINIHAFGQEMADHLGENAEFIRECIALRKYGVLQYIDKKYFDITRPENMTIHKPTKKDALVRCSIGNGAFTTRLLSDVTGIIIDGYGSDVSGYLHAKHANAKQWHAKHGCTRTPGPVPNPNPNPTPTPSVMAMVRHFMADVGGPLEMDISPFDVDSGYDDRKWTDKDREKKKKEIHLLMHARIYENSTKLR